MIIPFDANAVRVTSPYGERTLNGERNNHTGYDMVGIGSHTVVAAVGGVVVQSRIVTDKSNATWQWGNYVCIKTDAGQYHYYCHLKSRAVSKGQYVRAGDTLGVMGNTGYSFGSHLHFEVRGADGKATLPPETVLKIPNKTGIYEKSALAADLQVLMSRGILRTPAYWEQTAPRVQYLPELIHNMAEALK